MIKIYRNDLIFSISYALDYVEHDLVMIAPHHCKRIALLSGLLGKYLGYPTQQLLNLSACAALHDNALSEYQQLKAADGIIATPELFLEDLGLHCRIGEKNIESLSFYPLVKGAILYHHENADGSGPFGKKASEIPAFSRIIHIADTIDAQFNLSLMDQDKFARIGAFILEQTGILYDQEIATAFLACFTTPQKLHLDLSTLDQRLLQELPEVETAYRPEDLITLANFFARIIDYKSRFTYTHSSGVAQKAAQMGKYYGWDEDMQAELYLAGSLHDVGKLMVSSELLEKPGKLSNMEFEQIKEHAKGSYTVLWPIRGLENVSRWAYNHHEKLNGSGYPFGRDASDLGPQERLIACLDIYQALREDRPYRAGMTHEEAMKILREMMTLGHLDPQIVADINLCFKDSPHPSSQPPA